MTAVRRRSSYGTAGGLAVALQSLLPQRLSCALIHRVARVENRFVKNALIRWFSKRYAIDTSEAALAGHDDYPTFNAFFTRALKEGARPIDADAHSIVSPADGRLTEFGTIGDGTLLQAKGLHYTIDELLGHPGRNDGNVSPGAPGDSRRSDAPLIEHGADAAPFVGGTFATVYLAPRDYHRVHAPVAGRLVSTHYIPGRRFAVNEMTASAVDKLFCRNERVVCRFEGEFGQAAVVLVGALNVASISTARLGEIASGVAKRWEEPEPVGYARGEEIGRFNLGSTVILAFSRGAAVWDEALVRGQTLRMGKRIGALTPAGRS